MFLASDRVWFFMLPTPIRIENTSFFLYLTECPVFIYTGLRKEIVSPDLCRFAPKWSSWKGLGGTFDAGLLKICKPFISYFNGPVKFLSSPFTNANQFSFFGRRGVLIIIGFQISPRHFPIDISRFLTNQNLFLFWANIIQVRRSLEQNLFFLLTCIVQRTVGLFPCFWHLIHQNRVVLLFPMPVRPSLIFAVFLEWICSSL